MNFFLVLVLRKSCFKSEKGTLDEYSTIEVFIFANFQKVGVALPESCLFVLPLWRVLGESCFKQRKVPFDEYLCH